MQKKKGKKEKTVKDKLVLHEFRKFPKSWFRNVSQWRARVSQMGDGAYPYGGERGEGAPTYYFDNFLHKMEDKKIEAQKWRNLGREGGGRPLRPLL